MNYEINYLRSSFFTGLFKYVSIPLSDAYYFSDWRAWADVPTIYNFGNIALISRVV